MRKNLLLLFILSAAICNAQTFTITLPKSLSDKPLDGRLFIIFSKKETPEPRLQNQLFFGVDVDDWKPGATKTVTTNSYGFPIENLKDLAAGDYYIQAFLHIYETFHRKDGHVVKLPMEHGEGAQWNVQPGNLYSTTKKISYNPSAKFTLSLSFDKIIEPIKEPEDSKYVKHIKIQSKLLSEFWGRPMYLGAHVLLPEGWDTHTDVKYPLAIFHGHFPADLADWRTTPPDENLKPDSSARFRITGYNKIEQQEAYNFYKKWTGADFPRVIAIEIQHANQFYDDSYAVNSANLGPWGDAITYELIPEIEKRFRGIGQGWARFVYGGSTGGWESLAVQVFYPDQYNGCYAACPDPIDFRGYTVVDIYKDKNAYFTESGFQKTPRSGMRDYLGNTTITLQQANLQELALGDKTRSRGQWDIWEAVFSPLGKDGYPQRIWDKRTGEINKDVAKYWQDNYDLSHIIQRDWTKNGENWKGKIHIYVGELDNYFLNNAVYSAEDVLKKLKNPECNCQVDYEPRAEHCWNGDHTQPNYISRLRYHQMFITKWAEEVKTRSPQGADLTSWRY
jgi:hypothetical protein